MGVSPSSAEAPSSKGTLMMSTPRLLSRLAECALPFDADAIIDYAEVLQTNLSGVLGKYYSSQLFIEQNGVSVVFRLLNAVVNYELCFEALMRVLETQAANRPAMVQLLRLNGFDFVVKCEAKYAEYPDIMWPLLAVKNGMIEHGSAIAIREIMYQQDMLRLCESCQCCLEKARPIHGEQRKGKNAKVLTMASSTTDRVDRILSFMQVYVLKHALQCHALDALLLFVRRRDLTQITASPRLVPVVAAALVEYAGTKAGVVWRACLVLQELAALDKTLAKDVALLDAHSVVVAQYPRLHRRPRVQQVIVRLLAALVQWGPQDVCRLTVQQSAPCMQLLLQLNDEAVAKSRKSRRVSVSPLAAEATLESLSFRVVLPMSVLAFLRETRGEVLRPIEAEQVEAKERARNVALEQARALTPLFGTLQEKLFAGGEAGLVD